MITANRNDIFNQFYHLRVLNYVAPRNINKAKGLHSAMFFYLLQALFPCNLFI